MVHGKCSYARLHGTCSGVYCMVSARVCTYPRCYAIATDMRTTQIRQYTQQPTCATRSRGTLSDDATCIHQSNAATPRRSTPCVCAARKHRAEHNDRQTLRCQVPSWRASLPTRALPSSLAKKTCGVCMTAGRFAQRCRCNCRCSIQLAKFIVTFH